MFDQLTDIFIGLLEELRHSLFFHTEVTLRLPIGSAVPAVAFSFNVLLNTEKFHEHTAAFLGSVAGRANWGRPGPVLLAPAYVLCMCC